MIAHWRWSILWFWLAASLAGAGQAAVVAHWNFEEGSGSKLGDVSGNGHDGTIVDPVWGPGAGGTAISLNGSSSRVVCPDSPGLRLRTFTLSVWIKQKPSGGGYSRILSKKSYWSNSDGYSLAIDRMAWNLQLWGGKTGGRSDAATSKTVLALLDTGWIHIAVVCSVAHARFYINGTDVTADSVVGELQEGTSPLLIGCEGNASSFSTGYTDFFAGGIDELKIFDGVLSQGEIAALRASSVPLLEPVTDFAGPGLPVMRWSAIDGAANYRVHVDTYWMFKNPVILTTVGDTTFTPAQPIDTGMYYWRVSAGLGAFSLPDSFVVAVASGLRFQLPSRTVESANAARTRAFLVPAMKQAQVRREWSPAGSALPNTVAKRGAGIGISR